MKKTLSAETGSKAVDQYIAAVPEPARSTLKKIRGLIRSAVPAEATETISYGMPTFKYKGFLIGYAAFANHCSLFPGAIVGAFKNDLKNFETSKGTIRFPVDEPPPAGLIKKLLKAGIIRNELKKKR